MEPELLGRLLDRHAAALELFARQWCDAPEDVVQEAFVKLSAQRPAPDNAAGWLFRVVRHGAINAATAARRRKRHEAAAAVAGDAWFECDRAMAAVDPESAEGALRALPIEQREVIVAHLWGGLTFEQVAAVAGVLVEHRAPALPVRPFDPERTVGCDMSTDPQPRPTPELTAFEAALGALAPSPARLDRDGVMYQAGRSSVRRGSFGRLGWPALAAGLAVLAVGEGVALSGRPAIRYVDRVVVIREPAAQPVTVPPPVAEPQPDPERLAGEAGGFHLPFLAWNRADTDDRSLRARILRDGLDALPDPAAYRPHPGGRAVARPIESAAVLLRSEVDAILNPGDPS